MIVVGLQPCQESWAAHWAADLGLRRANGVVNSLVATGQVGLASCRLFRNFGTSRARGWEAVQCWNLSR